MDLAVTSPHHALAHLTPLEVEAEAGAADIAVYVARLRPHVTGGEREDEHEDTEEEEGGRDDLDEHAEEEPHPNGLPLRRK